VGVATPVKICVKRADDANARLLHHVGVDHRGLNVLVAEKFLHGDVATASEICQKRLQVL